MKRILLLAGAGPAKRVAAALTASGFDVLASLAGATRKPAPYPCETRVGGFGGPDGLAAFITDNDIRAVIDATHPFAARISASALAACRRADVPLARISRDPWAPRAGETWILSDDVAGAVNALPSGARAFCATGRSSAGVFGRRSDVWTALRVIDAPDAPFPGNGEFVVARPPFDVASETETFRRLRITHLVVKNSGGAEGRAKIDAAAALDLPIVVISRPPEWDVAPTIDEAEIPRWSLRAVSGRS